MEACPYCGGDGYTVVPGHDCGGNPEICDRVCPVPEQDPCPHCNATGEVDV